MTALKVDNRCACGGHKVYPGAKPVEADGFTHWPAECIPHVGACTFSCLICWTTYRITGDTPEARQRALDEWPGCCIPNTPTTAPSRVVDVGAPTSVTDRSPVTEAREGATRPSPRLLAPSRFPFLGVPAWIRRRVAVWPFDPSDFTT